MRKLAAGVAAVFMLAGCGSGGGSGGSGTPEPSSPSVAPSTETSVPVDPEPLNKRYTALTDLRDDAVNVAGYPCQNWVQDDQVRNAAQSGSCSDSDVFAIYASPQDRQAQIRQTKANNDLLEGTNVPRSYVLFGPNWSISLENRWVGPMRAALGGIAVR